MSFENDSELFFSTSEVNRSLWWTIRLNLEKMWPTLRPSCHPHKKFDGKTCVDQEGKGLENLVFFIPHWF